MRRAFASAPTQFEYIRKNVGSVHLRASYGLNEEFDVPFAVWHAPGGLDTAYPASRHATITCLHHRTILARVDKAGRRKRGGAARNEVIMYSGGYERHYFSAGDASCDQIYLTEDLIAECGRELFGLPRVELRDDRPFIGDAVLRRSLEAYVQRGRDAFLPPSRLEMNARATLLALHLVANHSNGSHTTERGVRELSARQLNAVLERMDASLDGGILVADLAAEAGLGVSSFFAAFRASTGKTPHAYLLEHRLNRTKSLLLGKTRLTQIALDCGFASQQHFSAAFRQAMGTTPGAWRKAMLGRGYKSDDGPFRPAPLSS